MSLAHASRRRRPPENLRICPIFLPGCDSHKAAFMMANRATHLQLSVPPLVRSASLRSGLRLHRVERFGTMQRTVYRDDPQ
jgi:hypothetical protein